MRNAIAPFGVELSLFRTTVGKEFEIIERLRHTKQARHAIFFGAYGYFDLAAIRCLDDLSTPSLLPLDCDIVESAPFRFFGDHANCSESEFRATLGTWKTAIATFFKIKPPVFRRAPSRVRWQAAQLLREQFPGAHVFFGLGFSEILLLVGGDDLSLLLKGISSFRCSPRMERATRHPRGSRADSLFVKTATFPFVSCTNVHRNRSYKLLKGDVCPVVALSCDPASEQHIIDMLPPGTEVHNSYGDTDLIIYWKRRTVPFSTFAHTLTSIRDLAESIGSLRKTTSYLETELTSKRLPPQTFSERSLHTRSLGQINSEVLSLIDSLQPLSLRASVTDLYSRLFACFGDPILESAYQDMENTFPYLISGLKHISQTSTPSPLKLEGRFALSRLCDLARTAINQRYAGLETHPETLAHSQSPVLTDIRSLISAATSLPHFIFDNLIPGKSAREVWPGYVIFGTAYMHQWYPQDILALPATAVYDPISEWWKITHEAAHAVYKLLEIDKRIDKGLLSAVTEFFDGGSVSRTLALQEIFANWFDWNYLFNRDTPFFLEVVWESWLQLPAVLQKPTQYLVRTFCLFMAERFTGFQEALESESEQILQSYLNRQWRTFISGILRKVPRFAALLDDLRPSVLTDVFDTATILTQVLHFYQTRLESACNIKNLNARLNPPYPRLRAHLSALERGEVITETIPNPCQLQLALLRRNKRRPTPLATQAAYVFSLENSYLIKTSKGSE